MSWMPSCSSCARACGRTRSRPQASATEAPPRFQGWEEAGVFHENRGQALLDYDQAVGIDWSFLAADS